MNRSIVVFALFLLATVFAGCNSTYIKEDLGIVRLDHDVPSALPVVDFSFLAQDLPDVAAAVQAYAKGQPDVASALMNRAIQSYPQNADMHFANGLIYLGWSEIGFPQYRELAEIAMRLAIQLDPAQVKASQILGNVFLQRQAYAPARIALAHAINQDPSNKQTLESFAAAAYYSERFATAKWASDMLGNAAPLSTSFLQLSALINASVGDVPASEQAFSAYSSSQVERANVRRLSRALAQWTTIRLNAQLLPENEQPATADSAPNKHSNLPPHSGSLAQTRSAVTASEANKTGKETATDSGTGKPLSQRWDVCDSSGVFTIASSGAVSQQSSIVSLSATQITPASPLVALPSPCSDRPLPRMVFIDVTIISADVFTQQSYGVNLLDQLEIVANGSIIRTRTDGATSRVVTASLALPAAGINYSLNIANAKGAKNEIVARPTLVAMDRKQSKFVNGESIFIGVPGNISGGQLFQIQSGIHLSVIPTFIDDDTLLMTISASRTLFQDVNETLGDFDEQLLSVNNSVTANVMMDMGQSLILSGLVQRQKQRESNKIPTGADVPGFSERITREFTNSLLFILTPRRAQPRSPGQPTSTIAFGKEETAAYESMIWNMVAAAGLNPEADEFVSSALNTASRAVIFSPRFLPGQLKQ